MIRCVLRAAAALVIGAAMTAGHVAAQERAGVRDAESGQAHPSIRYTTRVDWEDATLTIDVYADLGTYGVVLPTARTRAENEIRRLLPDMFLDAIEELRVDSFSTASDRILETPALLGRVETVAGRATVAKTIVTRDTRSLEISFRYNLYPDVVSIFLSHQTANRPTAVIGYQPTTEFTGIVIYARGAYPVHGERSSATLSPCLFPRIFDDEMDVVLEPEMIHPEYLLQRGVFGYYSGEDLTEHADRIGQVPFITMARAVFGKHRTDVIIPTADARRILGLAENIDLLQQGRIVVLIDLPE